MDWIVEILKPLGLQGVVIFVLAGVVAVLWRSNNSKDKIIYDFHSQRADEREKLITVIEGVNTASRVQSDVTSKRNEIMDELADAMNALASSADRNNDRVSMQADMFKEKFADFKHVIDSFGESNRVVTGVLSDIRSGLQNVLTSVNGVAVDVKSQGRRT